MLKEESEVSQVHNKRKTEQAKKMRLSNANFATEQIKLFQSMKT